MSSNNKLNFYYRVIEIDKNNHSFVVRYWTDKIGEDYLATVMDENNNIVRNDDGYPVRCMTDINITLYDKPNPSKSDIEELIVSNANLQWLNLREQLSSSNTNYDMSNVSSILNQTKLAERDIQLSGLPVNIDVENNLKILYPDKDINLIISEPESGNAKVTIKQL